MMRWGRRGEAVAATAFLGAGECPFIIEELAIGEPAKATTREHRRR
jgi:hypothetical protein